MARTRAREFWRRLTVAVWFAAGASPLAATAVPEPSYPERLEMIADLGKRYPGFIGDAGGTYRDIGLWAGIAIQTAWQMDSDRTELPLWERVNYSLTAIPFELAKGYERGERCRDDLCRAWYEYFEVAAEPRRNRALPYWLDENWSRPQRAIWKAHERSVEFARAEYRRAIDEAFAGATEQEKYFWRGWVRTVPTLALAIQATFDEAIARRSSEMFPRCSPLDRDTRCALAELTPYSVQTFVAMMIARGSAPSFDPRGVDPRTELWYTLPPDASASLSAPGEPAPARACRSWRDRPIDAQRRAALLSAYFFAYHESDRQVDQSVRPIPLADAARVLRADDSPRGVQRRRRAMVLLAAAGHSADRSGALESLGFPAMPPALTFPNPPADDAERNDREMRIGAQLATAAAGDCQPDRPEVRFEELENGALRADYTMTLQRTVDQLRLALDPQSWPQCSDFFRSTCIVDPGAGGTYVPDPTPPAPGSDYERLLFEHFVFDFVCEWVGLRNILDIDSTPSSSTAYEVTYDLETSMSTELPTRKQAGGLSFDKGHLRANEIPGRSGWSALDLSKAIEFDRIWAAPLFNLLRKPMLRLLADEIQSSACCQPQPPDPSACDPTP
jgi:hypothetical protein